MLVPVISKKLISKDMYIERTLPVPGQILVNANTEVAPYEHLGICTFSQKTLKLSEKFKPTGMKKDGQFYYYNAVLGKQSSTKISAPFNGNLYQGLKGEFEFREETKKYVLLSGVWGNVDKISDKNSVLIKTNTSDVNMVASTSTNFAGELVVFPNPTRLLERFYLEGFASDSADGKIVYVGNHISLPFLKDAVKYGLGAIVGGSADKETFKFAQKAGISFGLFSGFGDIPTPDDVYSLLNSVASRYVFFQGERNLLRIPIPKEDLMKNPKMQNSAVQSTKKPVFAEIEKGTKVVVLQRPYFGNSGIVDRVSESSIFVRFSINENPIEVFLPNFFLLQE